MEAVEAVEAIEAIEAIHVACTDQLLEATKDSMASSLSITRRRAGVWQRPAERVGATFFHRSGLIVKPIIISSMARVS